LSLQDLRFAKDVGADASLQITPYYNKPNRRGILKHFNAIAGASDLPIILYNIQSRTGLNLTPILELSKDERIIGIKEASGNISQVSKIIELTRDDGFLIFAGDDSSTIPIIALGGVGVVSVAANIIPQRMASLTAEALSGNFDRARDLHYELAPLFDALFLETNPIPVKKAAELMKLSNGTIRANGRMGRLIIDRIATEEGMEAVASFDIRGEGVVHPEKMQSGVNLVIGTTGFSEDDLLKLRSEIEDRVAVDRCEPSLEAHKGCGSST